MQLGKGWTVKRLRLPVATYETRPLLLLLARACVDCLTLLS